MALQSISVTEVNKVVLDQLFVGIPLLKIPYYGLKTAASNTYCYMYYRGRYIEFRSGWDINDHLDNMKQVTMA